MEFQNNTEKIPKENTIREVVKFTLISLAIVVPIRMFIAQPFIVSGASMDPTFKSGQYLIVDQLTYRFQEPEREDVIIFRFPQNPKVFFIKRVIGLPGETVRIRNGAITVTNESNPDGFTVDAPYVARNHAKDDNFSITLRDTEYFVLGDNRAESSDSRSWGPLERKYIVGRPAVRLFPLTMLGLFPGSIEK